MGQLLTHDDYDQLQYVQHFCAVEFYQSYCIELDVLYCMCKGMRWHSMDEWHRNNTPISVWHWLQQTENIARRQLIAHVLRSVIQRARYGIRQSIQKLFELTRRVDQRRHLERTSH